MTEEIRDAIVDAIRRLHADARDISIPDDLTTVSANPPASIAVTWKVDDELHLGTFMAWASAADSSREVEILRALESTEIPVPKLVTTGVAGDTSVLLAHPVEGESMVNSLTGANMRWEISATAFTFARMLARIHALEWTQVAPWLGDPEAVPEDLIDDQVKSEFERRQTDLERVPARWKGFVRRVIDWLELRRPVEVSLCLCHGQFWPGNIYAVGEDVTAVANWQNARVTDASFDLAMLPVWLNEVGLSAEEAELFAQAAHGAYLQSSPRGLANMSYYAVSLPLDQLIEQLKLISEPEDDPALESLKRTIERAMALGGRVPWRNR